MIMLPANFEHKWKFQVSILNRLSIARAQTTTQNKRNKQKQKEKNQTVDFILFFYSLNELWTFYQIYFSRLFFFIFFFVFFWTFCVSFILNETMFFFFYYQIQPLNQFRWKFHTWNSTIATHFVDSWNLNVCTKQILWNNINERRENILER